MLSGPFPVTGTTLMTDNFLDVSSGCNKVTVVGCNVGYRLYEWVRSTVRAAQPELREG